LKKTYSAITPYIEKMAEISNSNNNIKAEMYAEHKVNRGLRDLNGNGVVTGLTEVSTITAKAKNEQGEIVPCDGVLSYRGINVRDLVNGFESDDRFGFEETAYLLLFSQLPNKEELEEFTKELANYRSLPKSFVRDMILKAPGKDMMNILSRCVLALYAYDDNPDDISIPNVLRQSMQMIAMFPLLAVYGYQSYRHYHRGKSLHIRLPKPQYSTAENLLHILRKDGTFTPLEAKILDLALVLHAEHGGGNNSTFATRVLSSSGTDLYSSIAAGIGSLKGPRHGGANKKVREMVSFIKEGVKDWGNDAEMKDFLYKLMKKEAGDRSGLIYGMGHAVYTKSDPRAVILKRNARKLAKDKGFYDDFMLLESIERLTPEVFSTKGNSKVICANVDLYSGLVYEMLGIPDELHTPLFAVARSAGWCAHRIEELTIGGRLIRPAYKAVLPKQIYIPMSHR